MHWCYQESEALAISIPVVGIWLRKIYVWQHNLFKGKSHNHHDCQAEHVEHESAIAVVVNAPDPPSLTRLTMEEVDERFGQLATILLMFDRKFLLGTEGFPEAESFTWFVSPDNHLFARWDNRFFAWDNNSWLPTSIFDSVSNEQNS
jgi:hypothetical protein